MNSEPTWEEGATKEGRPKAVLRVGKEIVCTVYLSSDLVVLRIVLAELKVANQLRVDITNRIIDFKRKL